MSTPTGSAGPTDSRPAMARRDRRRSAWSSPSASGFFLLSDIVMFSAFFAAHAVLQTATDGGPTGRDLFDPTRVAIETACLLASSFTCGLSALATNARNHLWTQAALLVTGLLGLAFLSLEAQEFAAMIASGAGPERSAFLSSFFALVGLHGAHVCVGLLWLGTMMAQLFVKGFRAGDLSADLLQSLLARARHHLGRDLHRRLSDRRGPMSDLEGGDARDVAPGFMDSPTAACATVSSPIAPASCSPPRSPRPPSSSSERI